MFKLKTSHFIIHIACWIMFLSLPLFFSNREPMHENIIEMLLSWPYWVFNGTFVLLFYFHTYTLIPRLFLKKKYKVYLSALLLLFATIYAIQPFDRLMTSFRPQIQDTAPPIVQNERQRPEPPPHSHNRLDIVSIFLFLMITALGFAIQIAQQWIISEQRAALAEADKANAELSSLKAQINPHFMFNTLNNIYTLAVTGNPNTADSIMKLSGIMRYVTEDAMQTFVNIKDEVKFVSDYIDLQRLRLGKTSPITFSVSGGLENQKIAPLILMTFIENVFKYGISKHEKSPITIQIEVQKNSINFSSENRIFQGKENLERTGIGIENTQKRLTYLYPGRHKLNILKDNGLFKVNLNLEV